jgi:hypothetical protein
MGAAGWEVRMTIQAISTNPVFFKKSKFKKKM